MTVVLGYTLCITASLLVGMALHAAWSGGSPVLAWLAPGDRRARAAVGPWTLLARSVDRIRLPTLTDFIPSELVHFVAAVFGTVVLQLAGNPLSVSALASLTVLAWCTHLGTTVTTMAWVVVGLLTCICIFVGVRFSVHVGRRPAPAGDGAPFLAHVVPPLFPQPPAVLPAAPVQLALPAPAPAQPQVQDADVQALTDALFAQLDAQHYRARRNGVTVFAQTYNLTDAGKNGILAVLAAPSGHITQQCLDNARDDGSLRDAVRTALLLRG